MQAAKINKSIQDNETFFYSNPTQLSILLMTVLIRIKVRDFVHLYLVQCLIFDDSLCPRRENPISYPHPHTAPKPTPSTLLSNSTHSLPCQSLPLESNNPSLARTAKDPRRRKRDLSARIEQNGLFRHSRQAMLTASGTISCPPIR